MKKLLSLIFGCLALGLLAQHAEAVSYARSPKASKNVGYSAAISSVTINSFNAATASSNTVPGAVYAVYLTTGTSGDYCVLYDTLTAQGLTAPASTSTGLFTSQLGPRIFFGSTAANTTVTFDPPAIFYFGLYAACTNTGEGASVEFEEGRGLSGN